MFCGWVLEWVFHTDIERESHFSCCTWWNLWHWIPRFFRIRNSHSFILTVCTADGPQFCVDAVASSYFSSFSPSFFSVAVLSTSMSIGGFRLETASWIISSSEALIMIKSCSVLSTLTMAIVPIASQTPAHGSQVFSTSGLVPTTLNRTTNYSTCTTKKKLGYCS